MMDYVGPAILVVAGTVGLATVLYTGQSLGPVGWTLLALAPLAGLTAVISMWLHRRREQRRRRYHYTVGGVAYHYDDSVEPFSIEEVRQDLERFFNRWAAYYRSIGDGDSLAALQRGETIAGIKCYFRREDRWISGSPPRYVGGLAYANTIEVGRGQHRTITSTAHVHELSHIHLRARMGYVEESTAHEIFKAIGV